MPSLILRPDRPADPGQDVDQGVRFAPKEQQTAALMAPLHLKRLETVTDPA